MPISQVFILSPRGERIVFKDYKRDAPSNTDETFFRTYKFWDGTHRRLIRHSAPEGDCPPFFTEKGVHFCFVKRNELLFVCTSLTNTSPSLTLDMLLRILEVIRDYLGSISEKAVRQNFTLVYELLDEVLDLGIPQELSTKRLRPYIFNDIVPVMRDNFISMDYLVDSLGIGDILEQTRCSDATETSVMKASAEQRNEIYVDLIERLHAVFDAAGQVVVVGVDGSIVMKSFLVGTPVLNLFLSGGFGVRGYELSSSLLDYVNFHDEADYNKFESERLLSIHPPEGEFTLMSYHCSISATTMPLHLAHSLVELSEHQLELELRVRAAIPAGRYAINVTVTVPTPPFCTAAAAELKADVSEQAFEHRKEECCAVWSIEKLLGTAEEVCSIRLSTGTAVKPDVHRKLGPISVEFEVPQYSLTGLSVKALDITERSDAYNPSRWIRNIVLADSYVFRTH